jgi:acetyl-CoA synthetase (ADP-forming)
MLSADGAQPEEYLEEMGIEMKKTVEILNAAKAGGHSRLSEFESKQILSGYDIPVVQETLARNFEQVKSAASAIGFPVALKACASTIAHKTESGLIALDIKDEETLSAGFKDIQKRAEGMRVDFLVQEMIKGGRELVMGLVRDPQFGPCVMFGLGGIFTEALSDVSFRSAPLTEEDALEMMQEIKGHMILSSFRGMPEMDLGKLSKCLIRLGQIGLDHDIIREIDINPLIVKDSQPIAVDALIVLDGEG